MFIFGAQPACRLLFKYRSGFLNRTLTSKPEFLTVGLLTAVAYKMARRNFYRRLRISAPIWIQFCTENLQQQLSVPGISMCWKKHCTQLSSTRIDWHNLSVLHVSAKLYGHHQVVHISVQTKCALGRGLSYCKQWICSCNWALFLTVHSIIPTANSEYVAVTELCC